jgi:hypothetical protein
MHVTGSGPLGGFKDACKTIWREDGIMGFYRGGLKQTRVSRGWDHVVEAEQRLEGGQECRSPHPHVRVKQNDHGVLER